MTVTRAAPRRVLHGVPYQVGDGPLAGGGRRRTAGAAPGAVDREAHAGRLRPAAAGARRVGARARPGPPVRELSSSWWASMRESVSRSSTMPLMRSTSSRPLASTGRASLGSAGSRSATSNSVFMIGERRAQLVRGVGDEALLGGARSRGWAAGCCARTSSPPTPTARMMTPSIASSCQRKCAERAVDELPARSRPRRGPWRPRCCMSLRKLRYMNTPGGDEQQRRRCAAKSAARRSVRGRRRPGGRRPGVRGALRCRASSRRSPAPMRGARSRRRARPRTGSGAPGRSILRRSRPTYTSTMLVNASYSSSQAWSRIVVAAEHLARVAHEQLEQGELLGR